MDVYDLVIIGGGINGAGLAADAAGRGLKVLLCEMNDFASATSSWSTKLIHGGLRYLEQYHFKLVHEALAEREVLMNMAPFLIHPLKFILPHEPHLRPQWMIRAGLFLYDHLARRNTLPHSQKIKLNDGILNPRFTQGFSYYDCQTDDSRLTLLNALQARQFGATLLRDTQCIGATADGDYWNITLRNHETFCVRSKALANAAGPWAESVLNEVLQLQSHYRLRLVKGSHIVVPKLYEGDHAYILQNTDKRIVFTIPYQKHFTLIGTTDEDYQGNPADAKISAEETQYLCKTIQHYFNRAIKEDDIVWHFSGVRALYNNHADSAATTTREFHLLLQEKSGLPALSILGGKLTTYRVLAEAAIKKLHAYFPEIKSAWTKNSKLPGAEFDAAAFKQRYAWLPDTQLERYLQHYGGLTEKIIGEATCLNELGRHFGADLYENEVRYWIDHEWAKTAEDMLWRRSKLGLLLTAQEQTALEHYLADCQDPSSPHAKF